MQTEKPIEVKIRRLKVSDRKRLSAMIKKLTKLADDDSLLKSISSAPTSSPEDTEGKPPEESREQKMVKIGVRVLRSLLDTLEDETHAWFSDLLGVTKEAFLELPMDTEMRVIEQIVEAEESNTFFTIALRLNKKISSFKSKFEPTKGESGTKID